MKLPIFVVLLAFSSQVEAKDIEVKMLNNGKGGIMTFEPSYVKADPGDTLKFIPTDQSHNTTSVIVPDGAKGWQGTMNKGISVTLKKEGVYIYKCDPHVAMAMVGVVQVGKPTNIDAAKAEAAKLSALFAMNKDRLEKALAQVK